MSAKPSQFDRLVMSVGYLMTRYVLSGSSDAGTIWRCCWRIPK